MRDRILPPKLSIKQIQDYLEMERLSLGSAHNQLCEYVNNGDFPLYLQDGSIVENIAYKMPSLFEPTDEKPYTADGATYTEDAFYSLKDEIIQYRKNDIYKDTLDENKLGIQAIDDKYSDSPLYLDPESEFYAAELDLAIQLHRAIQIEGYKSNLGNIEAQVGKWLGENKPKLNASTIMIKRLSTIISIKKQKM